MRCERPWTIIALTWCELMDMFMSASIRRGKKGAGCKTPTTSALRPLILSDLPTMDRSPPKWFSQYE